MPPKLTREHLESSAGEKEARSEPREKASLKESIHRAEWQIHGLKQKIAELQKMLETLEAQEGAVEEPIVLEAEVPVPSDWYMRDGDTRKMWEAMLLEGRPDDFAQVYRRWLGNAPPGNAPWITGELAHDFGNLAESTKDARLLEIRDQHYAGWTAEDFQAMCDLLGIDRKGEKEAVVTDDGAVLASLFEGRVKSLSWDSSSAYSLTDKMKKELVDLLKGAGRELPEVDGGREWDETVALDDDFDTESKGSAERLQFMGQEIARVEPNSDGRGTFHFNPGKMREAFRAFLVKYELAKAE